MATLQGHHSEGEVEVFLAGDVITMAGTRAEALVISNGKVLLTGSIADVREMFPKANVHDFGVNACIVPGFHDAHSHPEIIAENALTVDISPTAAPDRDAIGECLVRQAHRVGPGNWVLATGYRPDRGRFETDVDAAFLDSVCPENPVYVTHVSSHWGVANSQALRRLGVDTSERVTTSLLGSDGRGYPNGFIYEELHFAIAFPALAPDGGSLPRADRETHLESLRSTLMTYAACGITATVDALSWPGGISAYQELLDRNSLPTRVAVLLSFTHLDAWVEKRVTNGPGRIEVIGAKLFADGALSGGTCLLHSPYPHSDDYFGEEVLTANELADAMRECRAQGLRPAIHANGDRAVSRVIEVAESVFDPNKATHYPMRIEHCSMVTPGDADRIASLGALPIVLATFIGLHGDSLVDIYGEDQIESLIPCRRFLDAGIRVAASSDAPAAPLPPLQGIQDLVTRQAPSGRLVSPEQSISVLEALSLYTVGGAIAAGIADRSGRLAPGMQADFTVLGNSPTSVGTSEIGAIPVLNTWVAGRKVFSAS